MKAILKYSFVLGLVAIILGGCASKQNAVESLKVSKGAISGTWTVTNVDLEGFPSGYKVTNAFDMAPYQDFVGSTWKLYGGYSGMITLTNGNSQEIYWSLLKEGNTPTFQFKKIFSGDKAREVKEAYHLDIADATKNSLILRSPITLANGNTAYVVYTFANAK